jgi:eukaryotic-like serine/threonine-protein kinase
MGRLQGAQGFSKPVAVKRLHAQYANDPEFVAALLEEARLSERIRHPNVVPTLDVIAEHGELLLVMEYVHGETLAKLLRACAERGSPCPLSIAAAIAHGIALGLDAAYRTQDAHGTPLHVVHRDISPQNVLVGADGSARLLDFGIAKAVGSMSTTREGHVRGKVPYMAPEQLQFQPATHQTDVYALAVVLWETLCAQRLFRGGSDLETWGQVLAAEIKRPSEVLGEPVPLDDVVMRGLARDPQKRYATALEMAQDIERSARLASPTDVATWVASLAEEPLRARSAMLRAVETAPPVANRPAVQLGGPIAMASLPSPPAVPAFTSAPSSEPTGRSGLALGIAVGFLLFLGAAGVGVQRWKARTTKAPLAPVVASAVLVASEAPSPSATAVTPSAAPVTAVSAAPSTTATAAPTRKPRGGAPKLGPATGATSGAPAPRKPDPCDPPFYVDEAGRKHFKPQCVEGQ